jgi:uncharacterized membrane-anchored protein
MTTNMQRILWLLGAVVIFGGVNLNIAGHERTLNKGRVVLLELAPRDPRSLMQGDYMALRFAVAGPVSDAARKAEMNHGRVVLRLDANGVGQFVRLNGVEIGNALLRSDEQLLEFRLRGNETRIVTNAYFFKEAHGKDYERARYGQLRVNADGTALLAALLDDKRQPIVHAQ